MRAEVPKGAHQGSASNITASTLATTGDGGNAAKGSTRGTQYIGQYDVRHQRVAEMEYDADWEPPEDIVEQYAQRRFKCKGMIKAMQAAQTARQLSWP